MALSLSLSLDLLTKNNSVKYHTNFINFILFFYWIIILYYIYFIVFMLTKENENNSV